VTAAAKRRRPRTCVGCREESPKRELLRIVKTPDGHVVVDSSGKLPGRGAYVCLSEECIAAARKRDALAKALKTAIEESLYEELLLRASEKKEEMGT